MSNYLISALFAMLVNGAVQASDAFKLTILKSANEKRVTLRAAGGTDGVECTYSFYAGRKKSLEFLSDPNVWVPLATVTASSKVVAITATSVPQLRRVSGNGINKQSIYFVAKRNCNETEATSKVVRSLFSRGERGIRSVKSWLESVASKLTFKDITLERAFPNLTFANPVDFQNAGDGSGRIFVVEQAGYIKVFSNDAGAATADVFLDIDSQVSSGGETGLLGLAFHPQFAKNGFFFVNYTRNVGGQLQTVISRFTASGANNSVVDPTSEVIILTVDQPFSNHNAGALAFGPDGLLYIPLGDGGSGGDPLNHGQNKQTLLGSILRLNVDVPSSGKNYSIPSSNPFVGNKKGFKEEIFAYGLRNPFKISFDGARLYAADVGQNSREEIDLIENGKNYGWRTMEGKICFNPSTGCNQAELTLPIHDYPRSAGQSVTGGYVYRGQNIPELKGHYVYGDFVSGRIFALYYDGTNTSNYELFDTDLQISSFGKDESGELYVVNYGGTLHKFSK